MRKKRDNGGDSNYSKQSSKNKTQNHHSIIQKHEERLEEFKKKEERLKNIENKIKSNLREVESITKEISFKSLNGESIIELQNKINDIIEKNKQFEREKIFISSGEDKMRYILESSQIIMKFVDLEEQEHCLLNIENQNDEETNNLNRLVSEKMDIIDEYNKKFENNYVSFRNFYIKNYRHCEGCNEYMELEQSFLVCPNCGKCEITLESNVDLSYKEMQEYDYRPQFTYDKRSHLEDWLRRFQSKENRSIPQEVLDKVYLEAKKERISDLNILTEEKVKKYLKKLGLNEYYDNVIGIINRINGRPPFTLTIEIELKIKNMFQQIQEPFEKYKPSNRRNFLSYAYTLHKFFQILGLHEFCKYFPLLKSADKLRQQDDIFKKIVAEMSEKDKTINWKFYPSI